MESLILQPLARSETAPSGVAPPSPELLCELRELAQAYASLPERSRRLYQVLRKMLGQPQMAELLHGIRHLAQAGEPAGARLLAAYLDAITPGARLIPSIHAFTSSRRLHVRLAHRRSVSTSLQEWDQRLLRLQAACQKRADELPVPLPEISERPGHEPPFPLFRRCLRYLVAVLYRQDAALSTADRALLVDLARLEIDAYQERVSELAGQVNPYRTSAVARLLPLLSQADTEVRDLREFIGWIEEGEIDRAFHERRPRLYDVLDDKERNRFLGLLSGEPSLAPFNDLLQSLIRHALPVPLLAGAAARLMSLAHQLHVCGFRDSEMDLFTAVLVVQQRVSEDELALPLPRGMRGQLEEILAAAPGGPGLDGWPRDGFELRNGKLFLSLDTFGPGDRFWRDDLPVVESEGGPEEEAAEAPPSQSEIKKMVMTNLGTVSVMLGFLRNPKIVAIPGLVADVVQRCRTLAILEVIANDRRLYTGFANKDVPLALLRNPSNIPIKSLRKFIHARYVAKVDLQRMARDKAGIRDEVCKEIQSYLRSLV
jgi:hypothetical protein